LATEDRRTKMRTAFCAAPTILTLSIATAMAEPAQVGQHTQITATHADTRSSSEIHNHSPFVADDEAPSAATGTDATPTKAFDWDPEPESISGGTEP
jgi:hypothetical protein